MKLTLRKDINFESFVLEHDIVSQAIVLIEGRESALATEKKVYTLLSLIHNVCEENVIGECNEDTRSLIEIVRDDIEPFYKENENQFKDLLKRTYEEVENYCMRVYNEQHSVLGFLGTITDAISRLDNKEVQEVLTETAKIAGEVKAKKDEKELEQSKEYREKVIKKQEEINKNLVKMMKDYNVTVDERNE